MNIHQQRIQKLRKLLKSSGENQMILLSSAPSRLRSRDSSYEYRQDSDFFYLTGSHSKDLLLLVSSSSAPLLIAQRPDKVKILWEGKPPSAEKLAAGLGAKLMVAADPYREAMAALKGVETLYFQNVPGSQGWKIASHLISLPSHDRGSYPASFKHSDWLLESMRLYKDKSEVEAIRQAARITNLALYQSIPMIGPGQYESDVSAAIQFFYSMHHAKAAFPTISACGASAATLHYEDGSRRLKEGEMLLVDWGAELNMYCGDITRVLPVSGTFDDLQKVLYQSVLEAQLAAIGKVKDGVTLETVYNAAARVLTEGLVEAGALKGKVSALLASQAYKPYFPHGIGHSLGLDVHDLGRLRGQGHSTLRAGMVLTIEPGLYFASKTGKIPACGIRIEDDILVTKNGCEILSGGFPKEIDEIEELMGTMADDRADDRIEAGKAAGRAKTASSRRKR